MASESLCNMLAVKNSIRSRTIYISKYSTASDHRGLRCHHCAISRSARQDDGEAISWASRIFGSASAHTDNMQSRSYIHLPDVASGPAASKEHVVRAPLHILLICLSTALLQYLL